MIAPSIRPILDVLSFAATLLDELILYRREHEGIGAALGDQQRRGDAMANRCLAGSGAILSILVSAALGKTMFVIPPTQGTLGKRFQENMPLAHIAAPLLIAQGSADALVLPSVQDQFVQKRCREGEHLEYRTYGGRDHVSLVTQDSALIDDLVTWTQGRLTGTPVAGGCSTMSR